MSIVGIHMRVKRGLYDGSAHINGSLGNQDVSLDVERPDGGDASVSGEMDGQSADMHFYRSVSDGYDRFTLGAEGRSVSGTVTRDLNGDSKMELDEGSRTADMTVDRKDVGALVDVSADHPDLQLEVDRNLRVGSEDAQGSVTGRALDYSVSRDPKSGSFTISGQDGGQSFETTVTKDPNSGSLTFDGSLPKSMGWFPLLWEIYGDDKHIPDHDPLYPSSVLAASVVVDGMFTSAVS